MRTTCTAVCLFLALPVQAEWLLLDLNGASVDIIGNPPVEIVEPVVVDGMVSVRGAMATVNIINVPIGTGFIDVKTKDGSTFDITLFQRPKTPVICR